MTLPTIVLVLEDVGLGCLSWAVSEEVALVAIPTKGEIVAVYDGALLALAEVLMELMELVAVSGKTGSDEKDIVELVNGSSGIHVLLGASECHERSSKDSEVAEIGRSSLGLGDVVIRVEIGGSEITDVELVDIAVSCFVVDSLVVRVTVTRVGFSVDDKSSTVLESGPEPDIV
ncbi:hypothetical protein N7491_002134 [Penicillium cf. griseofulvum]|nr:hypothetical protein N7491_002134 [Penicillium cf. griseofulvum]